MGLVEAIVLAVVQGLSEFLPISSSGHLVLVPHFFGWPDQGLAFDVAVHVEVVDLVLVRHDPERVGRVLVRPVQVEPDQADCLRGLPRPLPRAAGAGPYRGEGPRMSNRD